MFEVAFDQDWTLRAKACGEKKYIPLTRVKTWDTVFHKKNELVSSGTGYPFDRVQPIGHFDGTTNNGRPA